MIEFNVGDRVEITNVNGSLAMLTKFVKVGVRGTITSIKDRMEIYVRVDTPKCLLCVVESEIRKVAE